MKAFCDNVDSSLSNHGPRGSEGVTIGKRIFNCLYIEKNLLQNQQANFNKTWYKSSLGEEKKKCLNERQGSHPRGDNHKNANIG
jgi:hypothetical protein